MPMKMENASLLATIQEKIVDRAKVVSLLVEELNNQDLNDGILLQLDQEDAFTQELLHLSLNAISSQVHHEDTIRLRALFKSQAMLNSFASATLIKKLGTTPLPAPPAQVIE